MYDKRLTKTVEKLAENTAEMQYAQNTENLTNTGLKIKKPNKVTLTLFWNKMVLT